MNIKTLFNVYGLVDSFGNEWVGAVEEESEDVEVYNIYDATDSLLHFNGEAYHLAKFADEHGLQYGHRRVWLDVDVSGGD